jgi:pyridoxine/pyridoxamine 5'-phosphate oxidase
MKPWSDDLDGALRQCWRALTEAAKKRVSPLHTPVVATVDSENRPEQRVMVLRQVSASTRLLRFHTDIRTAKVRELTHNPSVAILGYDPLAKLQIRMIGTASIESDSVLADTAWAQTSLYGKRCYLADPAPGTQAEHPLSGLPPELEGVKPDEAQVVPARANFGILRAEIQMVEWLFLAHDGHRRARHWWNGQHWTHQWLVP